MAPGDKEQPGGDRRSPGSPPQQDLSGAGQRSREKEISSKLTQALLGVVKEEQEAQSRLVPRRAQRAPGGCGVVSA